MKSIMCLNEKSITNIPINLPFKAGNKNISPASTNTTSSSIDTQASPLNKNIQQMPEVFHFSHTKPFSN